MSGGADAEAGAVNEIEAGAGVGAASVSAVDAASGRAGRPDPRSNTSRQEMLGMLRAVKRIRGREYIIDPRLFNRAPVRKAEIPAANMHCSARALARVYASMRAASHSGATIAGVPTAADDGPTPWCSPERQALLRTITGR